VISNFIDDEFFTFFEFLSVCLNPFNSETNGSIFSNEVYYKGNILDCAPNFISSRYDVSEPRNIDKCVPNTCAVVSSPLVLLEICYKIKKQKELPVWSNLKEARGCPVF
jgi:hypothetical protein